MKKSEDFKNWYNTRAKRYSKIDKIGLERYRYAEKLAPIKLGMKIVDIGCKTGTMVHLLNEKNTKVEYHGIDISQEATKNIASIKNSSKSRIRISIKDVMKGLPIEDKCVDRIFMLEVMEHVREPIKVMEEIYRCLKPNGLAVISVPNPYHWMKFIMNILRISGTEGHISSFTWEEVSSMCEFTNLNLIKMKGTFDLIPYSLNKPFKRKKYFILKSITPFNSKSNLFLIGQKKADENK